MRTEEPGRIQWRGTSDPDELLQPGTYWEWPRMENGLPQRDRDETFSQYWARITSDEAAILARAAHYIGVLPPSFYKHYVTIYEYRPKIVPRVPVPPSLRDDLLVAQNGRCGICETTDGPFHVDHRRPISRGGSNERSNLWILCAPCNLSKNDRTVEEFLAIRATRMARSS